MDWIDQVILYEGSLHLKDYGMYGQEEVNQRKYRCSISKVKIMGNVSLLGECTQKIIIKKEESSGF